MSAEASSPAVRPTAACWFEIPAADFERAVRFYEALFAVTLRRSEMGPMQLAVFPYTPPGVGGAVAAAPHLKPDANGPVVYLNADGRLDAMLARVGDLGGSIAMPAMALPGDMGTIALVVDSEGNTVGLHAVF